MKDRPLTKGAFHALLRKAAQPIPKEEEQLRLNAKLAAISEKLLPPNRAPNIGPQE